MASSIKNLSSAPSKAITVPASSKVAVVVSDYYFKEINQYLLDACMKTLAEHGIKEKNINFQKALIPRTFRDSSICSPTESLAKNISARSFSGLPSRNKSKAKRKSSRSNPTGRNIVARPTSFRKISSRTEMMHSFVRSFTSVP